MSLDGFINDRDGKVDSLYPDLAELRNTEILQESIRSTGAVIMGKKAYEMANGDFTDYEYQVPIFVVTHETPDEVAKGQNENLSFRFETDGVEIAVQRATKAAGDKYVTVIGGANIAQQLIQKGLLDEIQIDIMPLLLCDGLRLFEHLGVDPIRLEKIRVTDTHLRTDLRYRVIK